MRAVNLSVLVVCCAIFGCAVADVSQEDFKYVSSTIQPFFDAMKRQQGYHFKLIKLIKLNDVDNFEGIGDFEIGGEEHNCTFNIQASTLIGSKRNHFIMQCDNDKKYHAAVAP